MSDVIGRGIIEVEADASKVSAGMEAATRSVEKFENAAVASANNAGAALDRTGDKAGGAADKLDSATRRYIASIEREIAAVSKSRAEYRQWEAQVKGISDTVYGPLVSQLKAATDAQEESARVAREQVRAQREAADAAKAQAQAQREVEQVMQGRQNFLAGLREQIALQGKSTEEVLRYRAAQLGVGEQAAASILQLQNVRAAQEAAAQAARAQAQAQREAAQAQTGRDTFLQTLRDQSEAIGKTRSELLALKAAQLGVTSEAAPMIARLREAETNYRAVGLSAKETAFALRGVPAQITDIIVSLQGGQAPLTVFLQQGGQLRDMFGSIGGAARALGGALLGLLVNPLVLTAAAVAAVTYAYKRGSDEDDAYRDAIIGTGNAAGTTRSQLAGMAAQIDQTIGTQAQAAEVLAALAATGRVTAGQLVYLGETTIRIQKATGKAVQDTVKDFAELAKDPVAASRRLADETNYLTLAVLEQIKALQESGRVTEAAGLAQVAYADEMNRRSATVVENLGSIERAWRAVKSATTEAIDEALKIGRPQTGSDQIQSMQSELQRRQNGGLFSVAGSGFGKFVGQTDQQLRDQISALQDIERETKRFAAADAERIQIQRAGIAAEQEVDRIRKASLTKQQQLNLELQKYRQNLEAVRRANPGSELLNAAKIAQDEANIRERFKERGESKTYQDDAATRMLQQLRQQEAALREQLETVDRIGAAQRARVQFEQQITDLQEKRQLTIEQKSLLSGRQAILDQLRKNEAIEAEVKLVQEAERERKKAEKEREQFLQRAAQIEETIAQQRQARQEQFERSLAGRGQGSEMRRQIDEQRTLYREAAQLQAQLTKATPTSLLGSDEYRQASQEIRAALAQALADQQDYYRRVREAQADWSIGAREAVADYLDEVRNVARITQETFSRAFTGLEDALTDGLSTGNFNFERVGQQIAADINRSIVRQNITGPLAEWLQGQLSAGAGSSGFMGDILGGLFGGSDIAGLFGGNFGGGNKLPLDPGTNALRVTVVDGIAQMVGGGSNGGGGGGLFGLLGSAIGNYFGGFSAFDTSGYGITSGASSLVSLGLGAGRAVGGPLHRNTLHEIAENGPELLRWRDRQFVVAGSDGGRVEPMRRESRRAFSPNLTVNVMPGASRQSGQQAASAMARELAISNSRNN